MTMRRFLFASTALNLMAVVLLLASCDSSNTFQWQPMFGNGLHDTSDILAIVGGVQISERDLELHFNELPDQVQSQFTTEEGKRALLNRMVEQVIMVQGAVELELYQDPDVKSTLISKRRETLASAMRNYGLLRGHEPSDEDLRQFFKDNRDNYRNLSMVKARHIECLTEEEANLAYARLQRPGEKNNFNWVCGDFSVNKVTQARDGELGYFNAGGFLPDINGGMEFTTVVEGLPEGVHPPFKVSNRWHVVEVSDRIEERYQTFAEARDMVLRDMLPGYQDAILRNYMLAKRREFPVEYFGRFAPGGGVDAEQLFQKAQLLRDPDQKIDLLRIIYTDYPQSDRADDALFLCGTISLNAFQDHRVGDRYLQILVEQYPDSELIADAKVIRENLYNPDFWNPKSIEDLRR